MADNNNIENSSEFAVAQIIPRARSNEKGDQPKLATQSAMEQMVSHVSKVVSINCFGGFVFVRLYSTQQQISAKCSR